LNKFSELLGTDSWEVFGAPPLAENILVSSYAQEVHQLLEHQRNLKAKLTCQPFRLCNFRSKKKFIIEDDKFCLQHTAEGLWLDGKHHLQR